MVKDANANARRRWVKRQRTPQPGPSHREGRAFAWLTRTAADVIKGMRRGGRA